MNATTSSALPNPATSGKKWKEAALNYGLGKNDFHVDKEYRDSQRIVRFDHAAAERICERLLPYVQEIVKVERGDSLWDKVMKDRYNDPGSWQMVGYALFNLHSLLSDLLSV